MTAAWVTIYINYEFVTNRSSSMWIEKLMHNMQKLPGVVSLNVECEVCC